MVSIVNNGATIDIVNYRLTGTTATIVKANVKQVIVVGGNVIIKETKNNGTATYEIIPSTVTSPTTYANGNILQAYISSILNQSVTGVLSFSAGTTGLTPNVATQGNITLGGVLNETHGGTNQSSYAIGDILYATAVDTLGKLPVGLDTEVLTLSGGVPVWVAPAGAGVTTWAGGTTGLTPAAPTAGAITLAGVLVGANGGTGKNNGTSTLSLAGNAAYTMTGGGTIALGAFTLTVPATGTAVLGTGTTNHVPYFSSANSVTSNINFQWDNTDQALEIGVGAPATFGASYYRLHLQINSNGVRQIMRLENISNVGTEGTSIEMIAGASTGLSYIDNRRDRFDIYSNQVMQFYNSGIGAGSCLLINTSNLVMAGSSTALTSTRLGAKGTAANNTTYATGATNSANTNLMRLTNLGCFLLGSTTTAPDATATYTIQIENGTAPAATQANTISIYSSDLSAGNTMLSLYTEGTVIGAGTPAADTTIAIRVNGTVYYLLASTIP
jgi:hypothetical protein